MAAEIAARAERQIGAARALHHYATTYIFTLIVRKKCVRKINTRRPAGRPVASLANYSKPIGGGLHYKIRPQVILAWRAR